MCDYSLYQVAWRDVTRRAATCSAGARHPSAQLLEPSAGTRCLHPRPVDVAAAFLLDQRQLQQHRCVGLTQVPTSKFPSPLRLSELRFTGESTHHPPPTLRSQAHVQLQIPDYRHSLPGCLTPLPRPQALLTCSTVPDSPAWCPLHFDKVLIQLVLLRQASSTYPCWSVWLTRAVPCCCLCERCSVGFVPLYIWLPLFSSSSHLPRSSVRRR